MVPENYPQNGHDWVSHDDLLRATTLTEALLAEKYNRDVAAFREQYFGKLTAYGAMDEGLGWAVFNAEDEDDDTENLSRCEVLLTCRFRPEATQSWVHPVPLIRIITNEPIRSETGLTYITEDVTIMENGLASYQLGAVRTKGENGKLLDDLGNVLNSSVSPLFWVAEENKLIVTTNAGPTTPHFKIKDAELPDVRVFPYGTATGSSLEDSIYALDRARDILQSIQDLDPSHSYGRVA
jgi:hypothetical protein